MPRSAIIWTRSRKLTLNVMYHLTHKMMISRSKCRPLNRSCAEVRSVIPAVIAGYRAFQQFAPEPKITRCHFNVSGLDTIKYNNTSFKAKAAAAIDQAIVTTTRTETAPAVSPDVGAYLLLKGWLVCVLESAGEKALYQLGAVCFFNLCVDFTGNRYMYFGNFPKVPPSVIAWRINKLIQIIDERMGRDGV